MCLAVFLEHGRVFTVRIISGTRGTDFVSISCITSGVNGPEYVACSLSGAWKYYSLSCVLYVNHVTGIYLLYYFMEQLGLILGVFRITALTLIYLQYRVPISGAWGTAF